MQSSNLGVLNDLVTAATGWHAAGVSVGVTIKQIQATMPDGTTATLYWDTEHNDWNIVTTLV